MGDGIAGEPRDTKAGLVPTSSTDISRLSVLGRCSRSVGCHGDEHFQPTSRSTSQLDRASVQKGDGPNDRQPEASAVRTSATEAALQCLQAAQASW